MNTPLFGHLDSLLLDSYTGPHMVAVCVRKSTFESSNVCAGKERDGRWVSGEKEGKGG